MSWQDVDDSVWADITPLEGAAFFYAQQFAPKADARIKIRYRSDIRAGWQLVTEDGNIQYVVQGVPKDVNHRHSILVLYAQALQVGSV